MARGGGSGNIARAAALTMGLAAAQSNDARENEGLDSARVSDSSAVTDEAKPSPLALEEKSYARTGELDAQRQKEARMTKSAEQFVGGPIFPGINEGVAQEQEETGAEQPRARRSRESSGEDEQSEAETASELDHEQTAERLTRQQTAQTNAQKAEAEESQQEVKQAQTLFKYLRGGQAVSSVSGITLVTLILTMDVQLINEYAIKLKAIPKLDFKQKAVLILLHIFQAIYYLVILGLIIGFFAIVLNIIESELALFKGALKLFGLSSG